MESLERIVRLRGAGDSAHNRLRGAVDQIKEITAEDPFLFLRLFTRGAPIPLVALLSFLVPLFAIGLGFDSVNGEHNRRTLSRILAQPIYRDALLAATAALVALGLWLFLTILWPLFSPALADAVTTAGDVLGVLDTRQAFARLSPTVLFNEIVAVVLDPSVRSTQQSMLAALGLALIERGAIPDAPIPLLQSVLIVWPQIVGLVAGAILLFVAAYVVFQRQEVRA